MMSEPITFEILCINPDRKRLRDLLTDQVGKNVVRFEEVKDTSFAKFKVTFETHYHVWQMAVMWGRAQILAKTNIE